MSKVYLRLAEWTDMGLLFEWANDNETRANSYNSALIEYDEHKRWFNNCIQNKNIDIYICILDDEPVGQIRLNHDNKSAVISYSIDKHFRGKGIGRAIIKLIEANTILTHPTTELLFGSVKIENIASQKIFEKSGYKKELVEGENGHIVYSKKTSIKTGYVDLYFDI